MKGRIAIASVLLLASTMLLAGPRDNGYVLSTESVNPEADAAAIAKMRHKMDSVRCHRPTVGLVLSGGGAKGAAHVGVLRFLEEQQIPIDLITGTSMGGLIGGLYALGYDAAQLDTLVSTADWNIVLSDKVDPSHMSYARKQYRNRFALEVPFGYDKKDFEKQTRGAGVKLGSGEKGFISSLPSGYISGLNVNAIFSSLSVGYQGDIDFTELPIPFCCVASDLVSGKAKNWTSGSIITALRSTMSIPGMFDPVRVDGMVLMDGGTRNNFPTDLARAMGADIIIGVELSDKDKTYEEVNNVGDVFMQSISMLGQPAFEKNVDGTDVFIKPDMSGYNMLSFDSASISTIVERGYVAAEACKDDILRVKSAVGGATLRLNAPKALDLRAEKVLLSGIEFNGVYDEEARYLASKLPLKAGQTAGADELKSALDELYGTGAFKSIKYYLLETGNGYHLVFDCVKGPIHRFGMGGCLDSEEFANIYMNVGLNHYRLTGPKFDMTARLGMSFGLDMLFSLDLTGSPTFNLEASVFRPQCYLNDLGMGYKLSFWNVDTKLYLSNMHWKVFDWKAGIRYDYDSIAELMSKEGLPPIVEMDDLRESAASLFLEGGVYTMDNKAFPTTGIDMNLGYRWAFAGAEKSFPGKFHAANFNIRKAFGISSRVALILSFDTRFLFQDNSGTASTFDCNYAGGDMRGRYFEQQVPFVGFVYPDALKDMMGAMQIEPRVRLFKKCFVSVQGGVLKDADTMGDLFSGMDNLYWGAGFKLGYNSLLGPIKFITGWNSYCKTWTVSASLGFDF